MVTALAAFAAYAMRCVTLVGDDAQQRHARGGMVWRAARVQPPLLPRHAATKRCFISACSCLFLQTCIACLIACPVSLRLLCCLRILSYMVRMPPAAHLVPAFRAHCCLRGVVGSLLRARATRCTRAARVHLIPFCVLSPGPCLLSFMPLIYLLFRGSVLLLPAFSARLYTCRQATPASQNLAIRACLFSACNAAACLPLLTCACHLIQHTHFLYRGRLSSPFVHMPAFTCRLRHAAYCLRKPAVFFLRFFLPIIWFRLLTTGFPHNLATAPGLRGSALCCPHRAL